MLLSDMFSNIKDKKMSKGVEVLFITGLGTMALGGVCIYISSNIDAGKIWKDIGELVFIAGIAQVLASMGFTFYSACTQVKEINESSSTYQSYGTMSKEANTTNDGRSAEGNDSTIIRVEQVDAKETFSDDSLRRDEESQDKKDASGFQYCTLL